MAHSDIQQQVLNPYDEIPYQGQVVTESHPNHLATIATLFGMQPPPLDGCRVLELGCAEGSNLIPMAAGHPAGKFVGVDLSPRQIGIGRQAVEQLSLTNVELRQGDIRELSASLGRFDYIILHGVYSWVPDDVRTKIFEFCRENLNPHGVVYISYTTYPGGHIREMARKMMFYHVRKESNARKRIEKSREILKFLVETVPAEKSAYGAVLNWEWSHIAKTSDHHVRHDSLSEVMEPCYFFEFAERARSHGLQYLGDATFQSMQAEDLDPGVYDTLRQFSENLVELEQYMDFVRNRTFRKTLLCHQEVRLKRRVAPSVLPSYHVASPLTSDASSREIGSAAEVLFRHPAGGEVKVRKPFTKMAFQILAEMWPRNTSFETLLSQTRDRLAGGSADVSSVPGINDDVNDLADGLLACFRRGFVRFDVGSVRCANAPGPRPHASPVARLQAQFGDSVTNLRHEPVVVDPLVRWLLPSLDGSRDRDTLLAMLNEHSRQGTIVLEKPDGERLDDPKQLREELETRLNTGLDGLAKSALLLD